MTTVEVFATKVGPTAGDIWQLLDNNGSFSKTEIVKMIDAISDQVMQLTGWLAREGKLTVETERRRKTASFSSKI